MAQLESTEFTTENYDTVEYGLAPGSTLPDGVTLSKDGLIEGTPTTAGTYTVTIRLTATQGGDGGGSKGSKDSKMISTRGMGGNKGGSTTTTTTVDYVVTFVITGGSSETPETPDYITSDEVQDMIDQAIKDAIADLDKDDGSDTAPVEEGSGCNGSAVSTAIAAGAGLAIAAAAAVVFYNRKKKDN